MKIIQTVIMVSVFAWTAQAQAIETQKVVDGYLAIKEALVKSDGSEAQKSAVSLHSVVGFGEVGSNMKASVAKIAGTTSVDVQREVFKVLSDQVYALVKAEDGGEFSLYQQFCPMALKNSGASWLSASREIENPYFGSMMLKCGTLKETLN